MLGSASVVSSAPPGFPPLSAPSSSMFFVPPASASSSSLPPAAPLLALPTASSSSDPSLAGFAAPSWGSAPTVPVGPPLAPGPQPSLFRPFMVSDPPLLSSASACAPLRLAPLLVLLGLPPLLVLLGLPPLPLALRPAVQASLLDPVLRHPCLRGRRALRPLLLRLSRLLRILLTIPLRLGLLILRCAVQDPEALVPPPLSDSIRAEVRCMYQYLVDLFPQAAGSSQASPPCALFEEFFAPPPSHQLVYLAWFERVRSALSEADSRLASLLASGCPESSLLPPHNAQYSVGGEASLCSAAPVNPSLLAMFERPLRPSLHLGLTIRQAALLEASSWALSESLSHAMWLLGFVRLQGFLPSDALLFNTLVTSLSKCLAHQASILASHTAFVDLKWHQFYLSHLPAYFSDAHKCAMLAALLGCADSLFAESDISCLLSDTQTSSSLRSRQALVDVAPTRIGAWRRRFSPARSLSRSSPSRRRCRESGSPSSLSKRVRFDSPAPSSALKSSNKGLRR